MPVDLDVTIRVRPPQGRAVPSAPRPARLRGPHGASFTLQARRDREHGSLIVERHVQVPIMRIDPREYRSFATFCRAADEAESRELAIDM